MFVSAVEPLTYSFVSTVSRFSGFFYQCYLIPMGLAVIVLCLGEAEKPAPARVILSVLGTCLGGALVYFIIAPAFGDFRYLGMASHIALLAVIILYAALFSPMQAQVRIVVTAAVIADINWAQSISTQILMPVLSLGLSNTIQFLLLAACLAAVVRFQPSPLERIPRAYWLSMLAVALLTTACLMAMRTLGSLGSLGRNGYLTMSIVLAAFFVVNQLLYYLYHVLVQEHRKTSSMAAMQAKLEQDLEFYRRSETMMQEYRGLRHELKNHFSVMENLLREGKYDRLQRYFADYAGKAAPLLADFRCPNPLVTSIISHQMNAALAAGVTLDVIAAVPDKLGIADDDLTSLLSNMLDNGVEGCLRAGKALVKATLHTDKSALFITVTNPAPEDVLISNPELTSTKPNASGHGFGIPIIRRIAEKYDGAVTFLAEGGWFTADAMLYMEE